MADARLVLASESPRRLELLRLAGYEPVVRAAGVDEAAVAGEVPAAYVARLARSKALAVARAGNEVVLGADTAVVADGEALGKPVDAADARVMLARLCGREHEVLTGVAVRGRDDSLEETVVATTVLLTALTDEAIARYVATGEPLDKAGAYGIQGIGATLVERIDGSWTNVVGLPVVETVRLLRHVTRWPTPARLRVADRPERTRAADA